MHLRLGRHARLFLALSGLAAAGVAHSRAAAILTSQSSEDLRPSTFTCTQPTVQAALDLVHGGWIYVMPRPKDPQGSWETPDPSVDWTNGYWMNKDGTRTSSTQPTKGLDGKWSFDGHGGPSLHHGGPPAHPTKIEWLCSQSGGVTPRD